MFAMHATSAAAQVVVLGCKAAIAVLLLAAGGAKLADLTGFGASVALFLPPRVPAALIRSAAAGIAVGEIAAGAASLSAPRVGWLNVVVFGICCCFLAIWTVGYLRYAGQPCRCFGAMSRGRFTAVGIGRIAGLVVAAATATISVPPLAIRLSLPTSLGLLACGALVTAATFSATAAATREPGWGSW